MSSQKVFVAAGKRTPFMRVDGPLAASSVIGLSARVLEAMAAQVKSRIDGVIWGTVAQHVSVSNLAREASIDAGLPWDASAHSVVAACATSLAAAFDAAGYIARGRGDIFAVGGVELMSQAQIGLSQAASDAIRHLGQGKTLGARMNALGALAASGLKLDVPKIANRVTGKSMGEHQEETNKVWKISREAQDAWALQTHQRAVAAQGRGFFDAEIVETQGARKDAFPRADTTLERLAKLKPAFDRVNGTLTAGNSSPLTDGAAGAFVVSEAGRAQLSADTAVAELVDYEFCAVNILTDGLLMAPSFGMPRLLARNGLTYGDVALYEIHEAFASQLLTHVKSWEDSAWLKKFGVDREPLGAFPLERVNPNGGSVSLGHPFGATGARILTQAIRELATLPSGSLGIVSICADGGLGAIALLRRG